MTSISASTGGCSRTLRPLAEFFIKANGLTHSEVTLVVGAIKNGTGCSFNGEIDQAQLWKRALTNSEVDDLSKGQIVQYLASEAVERFSREAQ